MEIGDFLRHVRQHWRLVGGAALATAVVLAVYGLAQPTTYRSTSMVQIPGTVDGDGVWRDYDLDYSERVAQTYVNLSQSAPVRDQLMLDLGLSNLPAITVEPLPTSELVQITVEGTDAEETVAVADAMSLVFRDRAWDASDLAAESAASAEQLTDRLDQLRQERRELEAGQAPGRAADIEVLDARIANIQQSIDSFETATSLLENPIVIVEPARAPATALSSGISLLVVLGAIIGAIGGTLVSLLRRSTDTDTDEVASALDASELAGLPLIAEWDAGLDDAQKTNAINRLATRHFDIGASDDDGGRVILVTTPSGREEPQGVAVRLTDTYTDLSLDARIVNCELFDLDAFDRETGDFRGKLMDEFAFYRKEHDFSVVNGPGYLTSATVPLFRLVADEVIIVVDLARTTRAELEALGRDFADRSQASAGIVVVNHRG